MGRRHERLAEPFVYEARESWMFDANCQGRADLFFPEKEKGKPSPRKQVEEAKKLCADCVVSAECKDYSQRQQVEYGVWAGELHQPRTTNEPSTQPDKGST